MKKHIKQVAAWGKLSGLCNALGDSYKPSMETMRSTAMETMLEESQKQITAVQNAETFLKNAVTERKEIFDRIPALATRVIGAFEATGASPERIRDVNAIRKRFRYHALPKRDAALKRSTDGQTDHSDEEPSSDSVTHRITYGDFNSMLANFELFISQLEQGHPYNPAEKEMSLEGLREFADLLRRKNQMVAHARLGLLQARRKRDALLFGTNGMFDQARKIKMYVRSIYGYKSTEFKTMSKVKFTNE
jgi:hypothetical protein